MGETRVDLIHLLEDLRDAYPGALEETVLTEIVANALDSGADAIRLTVDAGAGTLTIVDDGSGMQRRELSRYHDIAASTKTRGEGIGFAGVGIKLSLLACEEVVTESRRGKTHVATRWLLASRHRAPWKWIDPPGVVGVRGTAVRLRVSNPLSPLLDGGFIEGTLRRHFQPLLEPVFDALLSEHYRVPPRFVVGGRELTRETARAQDHAWIEIRLPRKRKPSAAGYLVRSAVPFVEDEQGLAIATLGKVIKRGWDWLGVTPTAPERIGGLIEAPALAECLTLNKADFIRTGPRGATYLGYRKAIQEAVTAQLARWGDARDVAEESRRRAARPVERDLERVLVDLADDFPLLAALVERRDGGQRRLPMGGADGGRSIVATTLLGLNDASGTVGAVEPPSSAVVPEENGGVATVVEPSPAEHASEGSPASAASTQQPENAAATPITTALPGSGGPRKRAHYGLNIQFDRRPDDPELGRLIDATVWINESHPAFARAVASRSEGYHVALSVALSLASLAVEPHQERAFVTAFLHRWGEVLPSKRIAGTTSRRPAS